MTEPRRIFVGVLPSGADAVFTDGVDPVGIMLRDANAALDRERAAEGERARLATAIDAERMARTRRARTMRRFRKVLRLCLR
jgi:hypothetical protein